MATKIRRVTSQKKIVRFKRKKRIRGSVAGTQDRPRLSVFRSNKHMYAQIINDDLGVTLVAASTDEMDDKGSSSTVGAKGLGVLLAKKAIEKNIAHIVFDRSGYLYHGRVQALADGAREGGLKF